CRPARRAACCRACGRRYRAEDSWGALLFARASVVSGEPVGTRRPKRKGRVILADHGTSRRAPPGREGGRAIYPQPWYRQALSLGLVARVDRQGAACFKPALLAPAN